MKITKEMIGEDGDIRRMTIETDGENLISISFSGKAKDFKMKGGKLTDGL